MPRYGTAAQKEHLSVLEFKREKRKEELAELEQSIERVQQQQVSIQAVEQIEAKPLPLTSKVAVDKEDFQNLVTAAQKFVVQEKQENLSENRNRIQAFGLLITRRPWEKSCGRQLHH